MRGSPLLRTLLLTVGLILTGIGMLRFQVPAKETDNAPAPAAEAPVGVEMHPSRCGFSLTLSAAAERVELRDRGGKVLFEGPVASSVSGMIEWNEADPIVFLKVTWREAAPAGIGFAKLTLEPPGEATLTRYFEASGPMDDVWELPAK